MSDRRRYLRERERRLSHRRCGDDDDVERGGSTKRFRRPWGRRLQADRRVRRWRLEGGEPVPFPNPRRVRKHYDARARRRYASPEERLSVKATVTNGGIPDRWSGADSLRRTRETRRSLQSGESCESANVFTVCEGIYRHLSPDVAGSASCRPIPARETNRDDAGNVVGIFPSRDARATAGSSTKTPSLRTPPAYQPESRHARNG